MVLKKYFAHSENNNGVKHLLKDHLSKVALKMVEFSVSHDYNDTFYYTGLLHDFGKYQPAFQRYLKEGGRKGSVPHASWGAILALQYKLYEAAFAIDGHHKGLPDKADLKDDFLEVEATDILCQKLLSDSLWKRFQKQRETSECSPSQIIPIES